jgi:hypothetical protein
MGLRPTNRDENRFVAGVCWNWRGTEEVRTALDVLRPLGSLIRDARREPINATWLADQAGLSAKGCLF